MTKLKIEVDSRLVTKLPEMFGGNDQALRELLQNAYRSGARHVRVEWNREAKALVVSDDGRGETDSKNVFFPGRTGWSEESIRNPAGLGLYALLTDEADWIEFSTKPETGSGWSALLSRNNLEKQEIEIREIEIDHPGTCVRIQYRLDPWRDIQGSLQKARGLYPYELTLAILGRDEIQLPITEKTPAGNFRTFQTPVGDVTLERDGGNIGQDEAVWEYQIIRSVELKQSLERAAERHPEKDLATAIFASANYGVRWYVNAQCGVRTRLPDRSELIKDTALDSCAFKIVDAVVGQMISQAEEWEKRWPDNIAVRNMEIEKLADGWVSKSIVCRMMERAGWKIVRFMTGSGIDLECDNDGDFQFWPEYREVLARNPVSVASNALASAINREEKGSVYAQAVDPDGSAEMKRVTFEGLELVEGCRVGLAKRIAVEGVGDLAYLAREGTGDWEGIPELEGSDVLVVFAGNADQFLAALNNQWMMRIAMLSFEIYLENDFLGTDGGKHAFVDGRRLEERLVKEISRAFRKPLVETCRKYYALEETTKMGKKACDILEQLESSADTIEGGLTYAERIRTIREEMDEIMVQIRTEKRAAERSAGLIGILQGGTREMKISV